METVARAEFDEDQVTEAVSGCVDPSEYVPVAANDCIVPLAIVAEPGVTAMLTSAALLTVRVIPVDETVPNVAVMVALPAATPLARP